MHVPVLVNALLEALDPKSNAFYLDGTVGFGGHAKAVLETAPNSRLCGLDRDRQALERARENLASFGDRVNLFNLNFGSFDVALGELGWLKVDGAMLDLGVSSFQIDTPERGFSMLHEGPLDMRMDPQNQKVSAWDLVNKSDLPTLKEYLAVLGEEPLANKIARAIISARKAEPINTTKQLSEIVTKIYHGVWRGKSRKHPATRTFQALRMAVNQELEELENFLNKILDWLNPGGRLAIITFHSLEDRMVKRAMRKWAQACVCPPHTPLCHCNHKPEVRIIFKKPVEASETELRANSRSASAKLRAVEKL